MRLVCCALLGCLVLLVAACGAGEPAPAPTAPLSPSVVASSPGATPSGVLPTTEVGELVVARVNGVPVLKRDFDRQVAAAHAFAREQGVDPDTDKGREMLKGLEVQILDSLIDQEIVSQAARRMGVAVSDEEVQRKVDEIVTQQGGREQFDKDLAASGVTYEDFVRDLRAQLDWQQMNAKIGQMVPDHAEQIHVRHIQLADEAAARDVLAKLQAGQDFVA
ncbi:MAG: SurA N-terminal domain-containing protein, partial [Chloroflexi bacterium]|nr:SurA N-terminal domain-containing protein [Chloroflexota bacterium]